MIQLNNHANTSNLLFYSHKNAALKRNYTSRGVDQRTQVKGGKRGGFSLNQQSAQGSETQRERETVVGAGGGGAERERERERVERVVLVKH